MAQQVTLAAGAGSGGALPENVVFDLVLTMPVQRLTKATADPCPFTVTLA